MIISKEAAVMRSDRSFYELNKDFEKIYTVFSSLNSVEFAEINCNKTVHIAVDMVNGFVKFGALSSNEVMSINNDVADFAARCKENGIANYALCDCHPDNCPLTDGLKMNSEMILYQTALIPSSLPVTVPICVLSSLLCP